MAKLSAGLLLYRQKNQKIEVFLVHPGGPFWAKKDFGAWSIPKGEYSETEDALAAAKREFKEETGQDFSPDQPSPLGEVRYSNKKLIAWALSGNVDPARVHSNTFTLEWPPRSGQQQEFPEIDKADWFGLGMAKKKLVTGQVPLLERLIQQLGVVPTNDSEPETTEQLTLL